MVMVIENGKNGNSKSGPHVRTNLCFLISLKHLIIDLNMSSHKSDFFSRKDLHTSATYSELPFNLSTMRLIEIE